MLLEYAAICKRTTTTISTIQGMPVQYVARVVTMVNDAFHDIQLRRFHTKLVFKGSMP
jgi:hypothetical protein